MTWMTLDITSSSKTAMQNFHAQTKQDGTLRKQKRIERNMRETSWISRTFWINDKYAFTSIPSPYVRNLSTLRLRYQVPKINTASAEQSYAIAATGLYKPLPLLAYQSMLPHIHQVWLPSALTELDITAGTVSRNSRSCRANSRIYQEHSRCFCEETKSFCI